MLTWRKILPLSAPRAQSSTLMTAARKVQTMCSTTVFPRDFDVVKVVSQHSSGRRRRPPQIFSATEMYLAGSSTQHQGSDDHAGQGAQQAAKPSLPLQLQPRRHRVLPRHLLVALAIIPLQSAHRPPWSPHRGRQPELPQRLMWTRATRTTALLRFVPRHAILSQDSTNATQAPAVRRRELKRRIAPAGQVSGPAIGTKRTLPSNSRFLVSRLCILQLEWCATSNVGIYFVPKSW